MKTETRCTVCDTDRDLEMHHIAGRKNSSAKLPLCRPCHAEQTSRQWRSGVVSKKNCEPSELRSLHALIDGFAGLTHTYTGDDQLNLHRAILRLLALIANDPKLGPNPISNDRRNQSKRGGRRQAAGVDSDPDALPGFTTNLFSALALAIHEQIPDSEEAEHAAQLAAGAERLTRGLTIIEDDPRADELRTSAEHTMTLGIAAIEQLTAAVAAGGLQTTETESDPQLVQVLRDFRIDAGAQTDFLLSLAAGGGR